MTQAIYTVAAGTCGLILAAGASAQHALAEAQPINEGSGVAIGLVIVGMSAVAAGAWRLATWVAQANEHSHQQDERIAELEKRLNK